MTLVTFWPLSSWWYAAKANTDKALSLRFVALVIGPPVVVDGRAAGAASSQNAPDDVPFSAATRPGSARASTRRQSLKTGGWQRRFGRASASSTVRQRGRSATPGQPLKRPTHATV